VIQAGQFHTHAGRLAVATDILSPRDAGRPRAVGDPGTGIARNRAPQTQLVYELTV